MVRIAPRKLALAAFATLSLATAAAVPSAEAHPILWPPHHHGLGVYGVGLGLATLAATAAAASDCYIEQRQFVDAYGRIYIRNVRVCD